MTATVTDAEVWTTVDADGDRTYYPEITCEYVVDGTVHESSNYRAGVARATGTESDARRVVERYPAGATVTAHYDPADPGRSYLVAEPSRVPIVAAVLGAGFVLLGVATGLRRALRRVLGRAGA